VHNRRVVREINLPVADLIETMEAALEITVKTVLVEEHQI
jgi:hypothetical protein